MALDDTRRKDLDETRRLLYMALVVSKTKRYNLVGTLVNAIKHHQGADIDTDELVDRVIAVVEDHDDRDDQWVRERIAQATVDLGES